MALNGQTHDSHHPALDDFDEDDDVATGALQQQIRDLAEKTDDLRASIATVALKQAEAAGQLAVIDTKVDGYVEAIDKRLAALEQAKTMAELRAWIERLLWTGLGAGVYDVAQRVFAHHP